MDRLRTLVQLLPWLMRHPDGVPVQEVCSRFGLTEDELEQTLDDGLMVGVAPFSPLDYLDCQIIDGTVHAIPYEGLDVPLQPSVTEAAAAYQAADMVLPLLADHREALEGAKQALHAFLTKRGVDPDALQADLDLPGASMVPQLRAAAADGVQVRVVYRKPGDQERDRTLDPYGVFVQDRAWYLDAFDHLTGERRTFRLDRIREVERLDEKASQAPMRTGFNIEPSQAAQRIVLACRPESAWIADSLHVAACEAKEDGSLRIELNADETDWLVPILVNAGPGVQILEPETLRDRVVAVLRATLSNYR
ncbi:MAG: helix-turn-helix transcriptional regulator [Actinomycetota bacterium]